MNQESRELKERIERLTDEELLKMVTEDAQEYRQEALYFAKAELRARGIDAKAPSAEAEEEKAAGEPADMNLDSRGLTCLVCGGPMRVGTLVAEKELTVVFSDNREERFVRVMACGQCGQLSLTADYTTEVKP